MQHNTPEELHKRGKLYIWSAIGIGIVGISLLGWWDSTQYAKGYSDMWLTRLVYMVVYFGSFAVVFVVVVRLAQAGRALLQRSAEEVILYDARAPVLYLRSFQSDSTMRGKGQALGYTEEEQWVKALSAIGPVIALDCPWEKTRNPGAARLRPTYDNWQEIVCSYLATARLTVIRVSNTSALQWEMEQAKGLVKPESLVFLLPGRRELNYKEFQHFANERLGISLPIPKQETLRQRLGLRTPLLPKISDYLSVEHMLMFDAKWNPVLLDIPVNMLHFLRSPLKSGLTASIRYALKPVFNNLGIFWNRPSLKLGPIIVAVIFIVATVVGILEHK